MTRLVPVGALGVLAAWSTACVARGAAAPPEPFCPGGVRPNPDVLLCENFEDWEYHRRWDIGGHSGTRPLSDFVLCTGGAFGFHDSCAAWSNQLTFDREWGFYGYDARLPFPSQQEFYLRWYQYISDPFVWGSLEDKSVMLRDRAETLVAYVGTSRDQRPAQPDSGPGMPFVANYQDIDVPETGGRFTKVNRFQNQNADIALRPGRWYLFEWYLRMNTPGRSDGATALWIDDASQPIERQTLRMEYSDMRWLRERDAGKAFGLLRLTLYHQRCDGNPNTCPPNGPGVLDQSHRWDQIVLSRSRIGPMREDDRTTHRPRPRVSE